MSFLIGGAKAKTKLPFIKKLSKNHQVYVFGALAHCLQVQTKHLGESFIPEKPQNFNISDYHQKSIAIAHDFLWEIDPQQKIVSQKCPNKQAFIVDIGHESLLELNGLIKKAKTIIWMGPPCWFERFEKNKTSITQITRMIRKDQTLILGGGETAQSVLDECPNLKALVIDAGGALMSYLSGEPLKIFEK